MISVTVLALIDIALRLNAYHTRTHPSIAILVLSLAVAALVAGGCHLRWTLVFDYGFNVETAATARCGIHPRLTSCPAIIPTDRPLDQPPHAVSRARPTTASSATPRPSRRTHPNSPSDADEAAAGRQRPDGRPQGP